MAESITYGDYMQMLRENLENLRDYVVSSGRTRNVHSLDSLTELLAHPDPFIRFDASLTATEVFDNICIYH